MSEMTATPHTVACFLYINHRGKDQGVNAERLACAMDTTVRSLRLAISSARKDGYPICGLPETGYFYPKTREELTPTLSWLRNRAHTTFNVANAMQGGYEAGILTDQSAGQENLPLT